jgi:hypothetical protein
VPLVDVIATLQRFAGAPDVTSPISGASGLVVHLELVEGDTSLGVIVLGDAIELHAEDGARYVVMARRATFGFVDVRAAIALESAPAELVPLLARSRGGTVFVREHVFREGHRVRVRAHVEAGRIRDDGGTIFLDEVISGSL